MSVVKTWFIIGYIYLAAYAALHAASPHTETFNASLQGWQERGYAYPVITNQVVTNEFDEVFTNFYTNIFTNLNMAVTNLTSGGNPGGCMKGTFEALGFPDLNGQSDAFIATGELASANFTGDYDTVDALLIGFDVMPQETTPSVLQLRISSGTNSIFHGFVDRLAAFSVNALALPNETNLYIGGEFTHAGEHPARRVALWNGTSWTNLGQGLGGTVFALAATSPTNVYAGGEFTNAEGVAASRIAMWNGQAWTNLGEGLGGTVRALAATAPTNVWAAGEFTNAGTLAANRIALWNGTSWTNLGSGMDNTVWALAATHATNLYAGGDFTNAGETATNYIARWNGAAWSSLGSGMDTSVYALAVLTTNLYAGGRFLFAGGATNNRVARWTGSAWTNMGVGIPNRSVRAMVAVTATNVYAGGDFTSPQNRIARWNGINWSTSFSGGCDEAVRALAATSPTNLYVAGDFTKAGGTSGSNVLRVARWKGSSWTNLSSGMASWSRIAASLRSAEIGGWNGIVGEFGNILTNVDKLTLEITRADVIRQSYLIDNFYIAPLPEAAIQVVTDATTFVTWTSLLTNHAYRAEAAGSTTGAWSLLQAFTATGSSHVVTDTNAAAQRAYRLLID